MLRLLTGSHRQGKTTTCRRLADRARQAGITVGGVVQPAVCQDGVCVAYDVLDIATGRSARLAEVCRKDSGVTVGRFGFLPEGLAFGMAALGEAARSKPALLIVDEVGPLELSGGGWAMELGAVVAGTGLILLAVRTGLAREVLRRWGGETDGADEPPMLRCDLSHGADRCIETLLAEMRELGQPPAV